MAVSGSTNAIIHIIALPRRAGIDITFAGKYLKPDFHDGGGLRALLVRLGVFSLSCPNSVWARA